jgi:hypothetical protein
MVMTMDAAPVRPFEPVQFVVPFADQSAWSSSCVLQHRDPTAVGAMRRSSRLLRDGVKGWLWRAWCHLATLSEGRR